MRRVVAALVLACLVAAVWIGRATPVAVGPEPTLAAAAAPVRPPPSPSPERAPAPTRTRRAPRVFRSAAPAQVSGCVAHANGEAAADAEVHIDGDTSITTDDDGCFRAEVPPGDYALWASVEHVATLGHPLSAAHAPSEPDACPEASPRAARRPRRAPAGTLTLGDEPPDQDETFTDDDGRTWPSLEASDWTLLTLAPGEEAHGVELLLAAARAIAGQADRDATICVAPASLPGAEICQDTDDGGFTLGPLPSGPLRLVAREADGDELLLAAELPGPRGGLHLQLPPAADDASADDAAADDDVDGELADVPLRPLEVRVADEHGSLVEATLTVRAAGYLAALETSGMSTVDVPSHPGCVSVCASADHRLEACAAIRGEARLGLVLREPTNVHGFVRLPGGAPAAGARVRCGGAGHQQVAQTDARGQFSLSCARTTPTLELLHDGDAVVVPVVFDAEDDYLEIRL